MKSSAYATDENTAKVVATTAKLTVCITIAAKTKGNKEDFDQSLIFSGGALPYSSLYEPCRYVPPQREWFLRRVGLEMGISPVNVLIDPSLTATEVFSSVLK